MTSQFSTGRFSISGIAHRMQGCEGQDSAVCEQREKFLLLLVSDGVGSAIDSRVGAVVITRAIGRIVMETESRCLPLAGQMVARDFARRFVAWLNRELKNELIRARDYLGADRAAETTLSATVLGALVTESVTVLFGCGDGVIAVNDQVFTISSVEENRPDLPIYAIRNKATEAALPNSLGELRLLFSGPTAEVKSLMLGTDGVVELLPLVSDLSASPRSGRVSWVEELIRNSLAVSSNPSIPSDDATLVGAWRREGDSVTTSDACKGGSTCV